SHRYFENLMRPSLGPRIILHCDLDAFYPSCEIKRNRSLAGKHLIVGADPKAGHGRGVVMSCSYEARKFGVRSGMPISQAYKLCPLGVYVRPDFEFYGEVSDRVMSLLRKFADKFEQTSIDDVSLDRGDTRASFNEPTNLPQEVKDE